MQPLQSSVQLLTQTHNPAPIWLHPHLHTRDPNLITTTCSSLLVAAQLSFVLKEIPTPINTSACAKLHSHGWGELVCMQTVKCMYKYLQSLRHGLPN